MAKGQAQVGTDPTGTAAGGPYPVVIPTPWPDPPRIPRDRRRSTVPAPGSTTGGRNTVSAGLSRRDFVARAGALAAASTTAGPARPRGRSELRTRPKLLRVGADGSFTEIGYFLADAAEASAAYWISSRVLYVVDLNRGIDVLRSTGKLPKRIARRSADPSRWDAAPTVSAEEVGRMAGTLTEQIRRIALAPHPAARLRPELARPERRKPRYAGLSLLSRAGTILAA